MASAIVRDGGAALVGLGRMALSYPDLPADVLAGRPLDRRGCAARSATAPRRRATASCPGAVPSTRMYKEHPDRPLLVQAKKRARG